MSTSQASNKRRLLALIKELELIHRPKFGNVYTSIHCDFAITLNIRFYPVSTANIRMSRLSIKEGKPFYSLSNMDTIDFLGDVCTEFKDMLEGYGFPAYQITREKRLKALAAT